MPGRVLPFVNGEIYHVFNRGIDKRTTYLGKRMYSRAIDTINYYRFVNPFPRLSVYLRLSQEQKNSILQNLQNGETHIDILCFCLMPNHFHFCLRQIKEGGIAKFMGNFQNSYTRYFNTHQQRIGPLFLDQFKAVHIEDDDQLLHLSRYIHLNPYSSFLVKNVADVLRYPWSSLNEYQESTDFICEKNTILSYFKSFKKYYKFISDQAEYQRSLHKIKHLVFDD